MGKPGNYNSFGNGLLMRLLAYLLTTFIIPFAINMVKKKLDEKRRLDCHKCHGKLEVIKKGEYYCKNCKIIRIDNDI
jgi:hypothetical protein